jgi:hypothetical protein
MEPPKEFKDWAAQKKRIEEIDEKIEKLEAILDEKEKTWDMTNTYEQYVDYRSPEVRVLNVLNRERRLIMPYELSDLPDYGDVMSLEHFIDCVKSGGFINYDGWGNYVIDGKKTNIDIYPSDVKNDAIRKDFNTIIWFNR